MVLQDNLLVSRVSSPSFVFPKVLWVRQEYDILLFLEGPARHLDASRQKLTPHCLAAIFDSQSPHPNCLFKCLPNCLFPHKKGLVSVFQKCPHAKGNCKTTERQKLSRGKFCLAASRCLSRPSVLVVSNYRLFRAPTGVSLCLMSCLENCLCVLMGSFSVSEHWNLYLQLSFSWGSKSLSYLHEACPSTPFFAH